MTAQEKRRSHIDRQNPVETTNRLLEAAAAEFVRHGYDKARISEIARNAGVTVGAVYARWPDKTGIMVAALDHIFEQILPGQRISDLGLEELPLPDLVILWGLDLFEPGTPRDIFTQVFGSARNNSEVHSRLQEYIDDQFDQISGLVERGKDEGHTDRELSTVAVALFMQALGIGVHMIMSARTHENRTPSPSDWEALMRRIIDAMGPASD